MASQEGGREAGSWLSAGPQEGLDLCGSMNHSVEYSCFFIIPDSSLMFCEKEFVLCCVWGTMDGLSHLRENRTFI